MKKMWLHDNITRKGRVIHQLRFETRAGQVNVVKDYQNVKFSCRVQIGVEDLVDMINSINNSSVKFYISTILYPRSKS